MAKFINFINTWFDEVTPRFQFVSLLAITVSALFTAVLFLQVAFTTVKTMPVQNRDLQNPQPNIIFIVADALAANDMSLFGYSLPTTPKLDNLTKQWTVYSNAQSPLTCTVAALPTFMTGRYTPINTFRYYGDQIDAQPGWLSIPNALAQNGYQTWWSGYHTPGFYHMGQVFQQNVCRTEDHLFGALTQSWFKALAISKDHFPFVPFTLDQLGYVASGKTDFDRCAHLDSLEGLLDQQSVKSPFFIYYHYNGAHGYPYPSGESLGAFLPQSEGLTTETEQRALIGSYKPEEQASVDKLRLRYDEAILDQDRELADFIETLKKQGLYESSLIIITSDHGQSFDNGYATHCTPLISYAETHVPLLIKYPFQTEGQRFDFLVSTLDIAPTILEVAGLEYPKDWLDGFSLLLYNKSEQSNRTVFSRRYDYYDKEIPTEIAATDGKYRLIMRGNSFYLFDVSVDPLEKVNLLVETGYRGKPEVQRLQKALESYQGRAKNLMVGGGIFSTPSLSTGISSRP